MKARCKAFCASTINVNNVGIRNRVKMVEQIMSIRSAIAFYVALEKAGADVAYNGDRVGMGDFDRVLMRWRLDDGNYRVIYGDLRTETLTPQRLAEVEGHR